MDIEIPEEFQIVAPEPPQPDTTPKPVQDGDNLPYHTNLVETDTLEAHLAKEVAAGYVLSTPVALASDIVLVVTEHNPKKADKLLNT